MAIRTLESLRQHLQWAIEIEHATIPPYLTALYSIKEGHNPDAVEVIHSIVMEEMLHMTMAANVLNAVGGKPVIDKPDFIAKYPTFLPHSNEEFMVAITKFSRGAIETFLQIERPEEATAAPEDEQYHTIGQFYQAIAEGLKHLCEELGEENVFVGNPKRQVSILDAYYGGSGYIVVVRDLNSALKALDEVMEQGEGLQHDEIWSGDRNMFHSDREEVAHYFRFNEILEGRRYKRGDTPQTGPTGEAFKVEWSPNAIYNMKPNPRSADFPEGSPIREKMDEFNREYSGILHLLHKAFNGQPQFLAIATGTMYEIKRLAIELMQMPVGKGSATAGPSYEYMPRPIHESKAKIVVRPNGPYVVYGEVPLVRKEQVISEHGEPLTWRTMERIETEEIYALCRCGKSSTKPFCDGTHARIEFDGTEMADDMLIVERQMVEEGTQIVVKRDPMICMSAGFCGNRLKHLRDMIPESDESTVRMAIMAMIERCPSGAYSYSLEPDGENIEPSLPQEIGVTREGEYAGALWVTGNVPIERADGEFFETRNRVTLCRCGESFNKPLCDGTHREINFSDDE